MIKELLKLANHLDAKGLRREADYLDSVIIQNNQAVVRVSIGGISTTTRLTKIANANPKFTNPQAEEWAGIMISALEKGEVLVKEAEKIGVTREMLDTKNIPEDKMKQLMALPILSELQAEFNKALSHPGMNLVMMTDTAPHEEIQAFMNYLSATYPGSQLDFCNAITMKCYSIVGS